LPKPLYERYRSRQVEVRGRPKGSTEDDWEVVYKGPTASLNLARQILEELRQRLPAREYVILVDGTELNPDKNRK
jgi:hypothetical protein